MKINNYLCCLSLMGIVPWLILEALINSAGAQCLYLWLNAGQKTNFNYIILTIQ